MSIDANGYDRDEWYSPPEVVELARAVMGGIDLDPASCRVAQKVVKAERYYTKRTNGLARPWAGRVWLQPPYSFPLVHEFVMKAILEIDGKRVTEMIALFNNATETQWAQSMMVNCQAMCLPDVRLKYWAADDRPAPGGRQAQMLFYFGQWPSQFKEKFSTIGYVWNK